MLSEKAKGKQRAVDPIIIKHDTPQEELKSLVIRFTEGVPDLTVHVGERDAVRAIKRTVRDKQYCACIPSSASV